MKEKIKQDKNLILVMAAVILAVTVLAADPLGFGAKRAHDRAAIHNQIAIERAEAEKQIAIIKAETDAELKRIAGEEWNMDVDEEKPGEEPDPSLAEAEE